LKFILALIPVMRIALRRVAWALGKPMTKALHKVFDSLDLIVDLSASRGQAGGFKIVHRPEPKACSPRPEEIAKKLGVSKEVLVALFDTGHFFSLQPDEKKRLVFDLLGLRVTKENMEAHLNFWLRDKTGLLHKHNLDPENNLLSVLGEIPETLEQAYQQAFDERRLLKREMKSMPPTGELPEGVTIQGTREKIEEIQKELNGLHTRLGELKGMATVEKRQLEQEIVDTSSTLERLRAETETFDAESETRQLKQIEEKRTEILRAIERSNEAREELERKIHVLDVGEGKKKTVHARSEGFNGSCPMFLEIPSVSKGATVECKTAEVLKAISRIRKASQAEIAEIRSERNRLQQKLVEVSNLIGKSEKEIQEIDGQVSDSRLRAKRHEEAISLIRELEARKTRGEGILADLDQGKIEESECLKREVNRLQGELERNRSLLALIEQHEKKEALEKRLDVLEVLTLAFSPKGIMADLLSSAVKSLNDSLARAMERLCLSYPKTYQGKPMAISQFVGEAMPATQTAESKGEVKG
jgi:hypothetical protein